MKTTNAGDSWTEQNSGVSSWLFAVDCPSLSEAIAVGEGGTIIRTQNGGADWSTINSGTNSDLWTVFFTSPDTGFVGGNSGLIMKTTDGGSTWSWMNDHIPGLYYSAYFTDADNGYFCGEGGAIIKYSLDGSVGLKTNNIGFSQIKIYPNATNHQFTLEIPDNHDKAELEIFDLNGQVLLRKQITGKRTLVDVSTFNAGIYLIRVENESFNETFKLIKK